MNSNQPDNLDQATADRLARLRTMPVDTSHLDKLILAQIPRPQSKQSSILFSMRTFRAIAASVLVFVMVGVIIFSLSGGAVMASPDMMATFHNDLVSGKVPAMEVSSITQANKALADQWNRGVELPQVPADHVMLCCMRTIKDKRVACVLMHSDGVPVTMTVANASDMKCPDSQTVTRGNLTYMLQSSGSLNMVMTQQDGRWVCLIGQLPNEKLVSIASAIKL